ncbi:MAG: hypothetical protein NVSMB55_07530 [Mycobacteriales bacterium]
MPGMTAGSSSHRAIKRPAAAVDAESVTETIGTSAAEFTSDALRQAVLAT